MSSSSGTVLILEDDPGIARLEHLTLQKAGYQTVIAGRTAEALEKIKQGGIDLILLDFLLADDETGLDFYRALLKQEIILPAILVTGFGEEKIIIEAMRSGIRDFLPKTTGYLDFLAPAVDRVMRQVRAERALADSHQELEAFTYTVAHDLRAPIRAMRGFSEILEQDYAAQLDPAGRDFLSRIRQSAAHMDDLVQDLLAYSQTTRAEIKIEPVNLTEVIDEIAGHQQPLLQDRHATIEARRPLHGVLAHRVTLVQALTNLIDNGSKFVPEGVAPKISIDSERCGDRVKLWICDNGIGIAPEHHRRIFNIFERLHSGKQYSGTGIGLAMVKRVITRMNGEVGLESEVGEGSKFWILLPAAD